MKRTSLFILAAVVAICANAAAPNGSGTYYQNANGYKGSGLKSALRSIIYNRTEKSYDYLWTAFFTTDVRSNGKIWDMYSNITNYTPVTSGSSYSQEGDCYNREHSFPQSWFNSNAPMYTDLHHIYPTDGYVNGKRSNYPFGETSGNKYKSANDFSKLGNCTYPGYTGIVFEPADEYKGDFARTYFYMITCYEEKLADWYSKNSDSRTTIDGSKYPGFQIWQLNMLLKWAKNDPVSDKEVARNTAVKNIQGNRNPFIDYPGLEQYIWGSKKEDAFSYDNYVEPTTYTGYNEGGSSGQGGETGESGTDVIDLDFTGVPAATNYVDWSGKSGSTSSAVYAGNSAGDKNSVQLRSNNSNSGIISTTSGGTLTKVKVTWNSGTTSGRTLNIYGKNTAYSAATDLYDSSTQGTLLGTIVYGTSTELTISGDYTFVGLRSNNGAMYLDKIEITWDNGIVKTDPSFNNLTDVSVDYGSTLTLTKGTSGTPNFVTDGTVTLSSSNTNVVGVSGLTITPVAVGTALITVNTTATTAYNAGTVMFPITVNAPEGKTEAMSSEGTTATLDFTTNSWGLPAGSSNKTTNSNNYTSGEYTITLSGGGSGNGYYYNSTDKYLLMGKSGASLTLPAFDKAVTQIDVEGRAGASASVTLNIYVGNTAVSTATTGAEGTNSYAIASNYQAAGNIYTLKVTSNHNTQIKSIVIHFAGTSSLTATLNDYGYATFCSEYPLDFSDYETADFSAWQITGVNGSAITFEQVTDKVKGGTGLLLKGDARATVTLSSAASNNELEYNLLYGTLAPTFVETDTYYGLSGQTFVKVNPGTVPTGKALLPASVLASDVKVFTFVFEEDPDGIESLTPTLSKGKDIIYNVAGQRLSKMQKGINIVNGKKVMVK